MSDQPAAVPYGLLFDPGAQQHVVLGPPAALGLAGGDFTAEAWVRPQGLRLDIELPILGNDQAAPESTVYLRLRGGRLVFGFYGSEISGGTTLQSDAWCHVAIRYTAATRELAIFVNGVPDGAAQGGAPGQGVGQFCLGRWLAAGYFQGLMTELRLWSEPRSEAQLQANLYRRLSGQEPNLAGYWPLSEGRGTTARDRRSPVDSNGLRLSVDLHDGQVARDAWARIDDSPLRGAAGVERLAVVVADLAGPDAGLEVDNLPQLAVADALTAEAWVRAAAGAELAPVVSMYGANKGWELRAGAGQCGFALGIGGTPVELAVTGLVLNTWYHIAGVYDGRLAYLYVNSVFRFALPRSGPITPYPGALGIGRSTYIAGRAFAGQLAEVRLWGRARAQAEIQRDLYRRMASDSPGLIAIWALEGDGAAPNQLSARARGGTGWSRSNAPLPDTPPQADTDAPIPVQDARPLMQELERLRRQLAEQNARAAERAQQVTQLTDQQAELRRQIKALSDQLDTYRASQAQVLAANDRLSKTNAELQKGGGARTTLEEFVLNAEDSIRAAREELRRKGSSYGLERVTFEVKLVPGPAGLGIFFPQPQDLTGDGQATQGLQPAHLSTLNLEFASQEPRDKPQIQEAKVPSVIGYTEIMARRKLAEAGFQVARDFQAVVQDPTGPILADRVVDQLPQAGIAWPAGDTITIFIGRDTTANA